MTSKPLHRTHQYARDVLLGKIVTGPLVRLAVERHERDLREADQKGFSFNDKAANHTIDFIEKWVRLPDTSDANGDPKPFILEPWQAFIVGSLFGWQWTTSGHRRFRNAYIEIGKGNGKTPLLAATGIYGLMMDGQKAPEIYAAAADRDQAMIMFRDAVRMVKASPELDSRVRKSGIQHVHNLAYGMGFFRPFSREQGSKSGTRPHMGLIDEVHEHPNAEIINKMRAGAKGNQNAMFLEITNSGTDRTSVCYQHHEHSRRVLEGKEDDRWFAYVATLDPGDDPLENEACHIKVNPNLGVSIHREYLRDQVSSAKNIPAETNAVLRLNFCVWTQAETRFIDIPKWMACKQEVSASELVGAKCYAGLDLGQTDDFTAFVLVWVLSDDRIVIKPKFWIPSAALNKPNRPYAEWQRSEALEVIPDSEVVDYGLVESQVQELCLKHGVIECAYDKRFAVQMAQNLTGAGISMIDTPQGFQLTEALRKLGELVANEALVHDGHPVMDWMAANYVVTHKAHGNGEMRPNKDKARDKIDGMVALTMALDVIIRNPSDGDLRAEDLVMVL